MRTQKAFVNMLCAMMYLAVNIICGFITPRLILSTYGSSYNGVISSITQFLSAISILNLGIAGPTRVALYKSIANNDKKGTSSIIKATKIYMRRVALAVLIYAIVLMIIYPHIIDTELIGYEVVVLIAIISISTFAEYFFGFTNTTLLSADQSGYVTNLVGTFKIVVNTCLTVILIYLNFSIFTVKLGSSLIFFIAPLILEVYVNIRYKLDKKCKPDDSAIKGRGAAAFHSIANIIHDNTSVVLLTLLTDIKLVSVYSVYNLIVSALRNLMKVFTSVLEAPFGNLWAKKEYDALNRNFRIYEFAIFFFAAVIFSCAIKLIIPFVEVYTYGVTDVNYSRPIFAMLIMMAECICCIRQPYMTMVQATGNYEATKRDAAIEAIINIVISLMFVSLIGIEGVAIGMLAANLYRTVKYAIFVERNIIKEKKIRIIRKSIWLVATITLCVTIVGFVDRFIIFDTNWIEWICRAFMTFGISIVVCSMMAILCYKSMCCSVLDVFKRIIKNKG